MKFSCPYCSQHIAADEEMAGMTIGCPACNGQIEIPTPGPPPELAATPEPQPQEAQLGVRQPRAAYSRAEVEANEQKRGCLFMLGTIGSFVIGLMWAIWADSKNIDVGWTPAYVMGGFSILCFCLMPRRLAGPWKVRFLLELLAGLLALALSLGSLIGMMWLLDRFGILPRNAPAKSFKSKVVVALALGWVVGTTKGLFELFRRLFGVSALP